MNSPRVLLVTLLGLAVFWGCSRHESEPARAASASYASELEAAHDSADSAKSTSERQAALNRLEQAFRRSPEAAPKSLAEMARQDLADRAARLALQLGEAERALTWTDRGLALSPTPSVVRANLLIARADALEALGRMNDARDPLLEALAVNQELMRRELENP